MGIGFNDANGDYLSAASLIASPPISVSAWFYTDDSSINQRVFALYGTGSHMHECRLDGGARTLSAISQSLSAVSATTGNLWTANTWHHGLWTFETARRTATLDGGTTATNTDSRSPNVTSSGVGGPNQLLSGRVAELAVWNAYILGAPEWQTIKQGLAKGFSPPAVYPANLIAWFRFINGQLQDVIGRFIFTGNGSPFAAPHPRIWLKRGGRLVARPRSASRIISLGGVARVSDGRVVLAG